MKLQFVETLPVEEFREQQAQRRAAQLVGMVQATMGLESQAIEDDARRDLELRNVHRLLAGPGRSLWDE